MQLLLKQSTSSADVLQKVFNLTDEEKYLLLESSVGEGIFFAGLKHVAIKIIASYTEDQIITSDPSQILAIKKAKDSLKKDEGDNFGLRGKAPEPSAEESSFSDNEPQEQQTQNKTQVQNTQSEPFNKSQNQKKPIINTELSDTSTPEHMHNKSKYMPSTEVENLEKQSNILNEELDMLEDLFNE